MHEWTSDVQHVVKRKKTPGFSRRLTLRTKTPGFSRRLALCTKMPGLFLTSRKRKKTPGCYPTPHAAHEDAGFFPTSRKRKKTSRFFPTSVFMHVWFRLCRSPFDIPEPMTARERELDPCCNRTIGKCFRYGCLYEFTYHDRSCLLTQCFPFAGGAGTNRAA
jgi:hypothetical protein